MLKKILHRLNIYEKYNRLITEEGKRIFIRTVYTLSICTVAIILIWYCGIVNMASKNQIGFIHDGFLKNTVQSSNQKITFSAKTTGEEAAEIGLQASADDLSPDTGKNTSDGNKTEAPPVKESENKQENKPESKPEDKQESKSENKPGNKPADKPENKTESKPETGKNDKNTQVQPEKNKDTDKNSSNKQAEKKPDKKPEVKNDDKAQTAKKAKVVQKTIFKGAKTSYVALTFDDGYNEKTIIKTLDVLKKNNIKATFIIIGSVLDDYPQVWKRAINEGHQICNHTLNHATLTKLSDQQVKNEILGWETCVKKVLGEEYLNRMKSEFPYLRLPGGNGNKEDRILSIAQDCGYQVIGWNLETYNSVISRMRKNYSTNEIAKKIQQHVVNNCTGGSIILLHFNQYDIANIEEIVAGIKNRGYSIVTVTELLSKK